MANGTWKIARRGNAQLPLVIVLVLAVVLVLVGKAQFGLFDRARTFITDRMEPVLTAVHAPIVLFDRWLGSVNELFSVYQENLALKDENARLRQWRNVAVVMQDRARRYQALLHAVPDPATDSVLARVIGRANRPFLETMILDAGAANHVKPGEAVVDARGMIGRIYLTGKRTSWVILLTDVNSRVPVLTAPGGHQAMMVGDNTAMPLLDTMSPLVHLHPGDQVVSSGDGGLLPPGLPIGTVIEQGGHYRVALLADAASSEAVEVLAFRQPPEQLPALSAAELPAVAAGLRPAAPAAPQASPTQASRAPSHPLPVKSVAAQASAPIAARAKPAPQTRAAPLSPPGRAETSADESDQDR